MATEAHQSSLDCMNITREGSNFYQMFQVLPQVYISKIPTNIPPEVKHVLNMCTHQHSRDTSRKYLHIGLDDIDNINPHIPHILNFIDTAIRVEGNVLVHCALGLNRSAAAVIAFLCHQSQMTASKALTYLKERKPDVKPSALFLQ
jgi:protein-tyrosine phosphatase